MYLVGLWLLIDDFALIVVNFCNRSLGKWLCFREVLVCVDLHKGMVVNLVFEG